MAYTQADLDAVREAIASGAKTVQFADRSTTYRSIDELIQAEQIITRALDPRVRQVLGYGTKGLT